MFGKTFYESTPTPMRDGRGRRKQSDAFKLELQKMKRKDSVEDDTSQRRGDRPRLSKAFKDELRTSVHNTTLQDKDKKKQKGIFGFLKKSGSSSTDDEESFLSKERERLKLPLPGSFDSGNSVEKSRGSKSPSKSGRQSAQTSSLSPEGGGPFSPSNRERRTISKEQAAELRKSFHDMNGHQDGHRLRCKSEAGGKIPASEHRRPVLRKELVDELRKSVHNRGGAKNRRPPLKKELVDELHKSVHGRGAKSRGAKNHRPVLKKELVDELRKSVHGRGAKSRGAKNHRPALKKELVDELRKSVHVRGATSRGGKNHRPALKKELADELRKSVHVRGAKNRRPVLSKEPVDELRKSAHDRGATNRRPDLRKERVDELRESVHGGKQLNMRQKIMKKIMKRGDDSSQTTETRRDPDSSQTTESRRDPHSSQTTETRKGPHSSQTTETRRDPHSSQTSETRRDPPDIPEQIERSSERPEKSERSDEESITFATDDDSFRIGIEPLKELPSSHERRVAESRSDGDSRQQNRSREKRKYSSDFQGKLRGLPSRAIKGLAQSTHSTDTFVASFSDDIESFDDLKPAAAYSKKKPRGDGRRLSDDIGSFDDVKPAATYSRKEPRGDSCRRGRSPDRDYGRRRERHIENNVGIDISSGEAAEIEAADFDTFKIEWARLIREKKKLKHSLKGSQKEMATMSTENDLFKNDNSDLRQKLSDASGKVAKLSKRQSKERSQFNNCTDHIAQARVDLTKALNEARILKAEIKNMEEFTTGKNRRSAVLTETVQGQSEKIDELASRLRDTETEMRFNEDEKRRVEDELAVLVASRDGNDVSEAIRQLEQEKARWLDERERALETKRLDLDEESDRLLERDRKRYRNDADALTAASKKNREGEEKDQELKKQINQHCRDMQTANRDLQERIKADHLEMTVEIKKKDHAVALLEQQISKLKKKIVSRASDEKEKELQRADAEATRDDLKDALKHNGILERQIEKMKSKIKDLEKHKNDWQEVVLPGHRNLRGVTFGASQSESLAGFLTILVEEQSRLNKDSSSRKADLTKQLNERESKKNRKEKRKEKKSKDDGRKSRKKSISSSIRRHTGRSRSKSRGRSRSRSKARGKSDTKYLKKRDLKKEKKKLKKKSKDDEKKFRKKSRSPSSTSLSRGRSRSRSRSKARGKSDLTKYLKKRDSRKEKKEKKKIKKKAKEEKKFRKRSRSTSSTSRSTSKGGSRSKSKTRVKSSLDLISDILIRSKKDKKRKLEKKKLRRSSSKETPDKDKKSRRRKSETKHKYDKKHSHKKYEAGTSLGDTITLIKKEEHSRGWKAVDVSSVVAVKASKKKKSKPTIRSRSLSDDGSAEAPSVVLSRRRSDDESLDAPSVLLQ